MDIRDLWWKIKIYVKSEAKKPRHHLREILQLKYSDTKEG